MAGRYKKVGMVGGWVDGKEGWRGLKVVKLVTMVSGLANIFVRTKLVNILTCILVFPGSTHILR